MEKLRLNDAAFSYEPESSGALGFGFRCGFLGLLHMEIVQERLEREFDLDLITTAPGVSYQVTTDRGERIEVHNPSKLPARQFIESIEEPVIEAIIITPPDYLGNVFKPVRGTTRHPEEDDVPLQDAGAARVRTAPGRGRARLLRQAQVGIARLCVAGLPLRRLPQEPTWSSSTCWSTASRSTPCP